MRINLAGQAFEVETEFSPALSDIQIVRVKILSTPKGQAVLDWGDGDYSRLDLHRRQVIERTHRYDLEDTYAVSLEYQGQSKEIGEVEIALVEGIEVARFIGTIMRALDAEVSGLDDELQALGTFYGTFEQEGTLIETKRHGFFFNTKVEQQTGKTKMMFQWQRKNGKGERRQSS